MKTKKKYSLLILLLFFVSAFSQKLTPDTDLISELVSQKQDEIRQRIIKNLIVNNIKTTNYTTYNTMYDLMEVITTEKNKTVMTKSILTEVTNYSICYSLANYFRNNLSNFQAPLAISASIDNPEKNALNFLINKEYKTSTDNTTQKKTSDKIAIKEALLANYIMDEMYKKVSLNKFTFFESNGLFVKKDLEKKFTFGLNINYSDLDSDLKLLVDGELDKFIKNLDKVSDATYEVFDLIKLFKDKKLDFKRLQEVDRSVIEVIFSLFSISLSDFEQEIGKNSFLAKIGGVINKYVIYESYEGDNEMVFEFKIDVESIILSFEDEFLNSNITSLKENIIGVKPFFIIGLNYGSFTSSNTTIMNNDNSDNITDISFVGEKIGLKFLLFDFDYTHSKKPLEWYKYRGTYRRWKGPVKDPLIDDIYLSIYGSGILYNVVDLKSQDNFNFALIGIGGGITFFNNLEFNISYSVPIISNSLSYDNSMVSFGFDIPIFEYLKALKSKNSK